MIYYRFHLLYIYIGSKYFRKKVDPESDLTRIGKVSVPDCDSLRYMANSKYFCYMDFIRLEAVFRSKLYENTFKKGMFPVLGSQKFIYKKPLKRGAKFSITLVLEGWDEKWVYHRQTFKHKDEVYAIGYTKASFWHKKKAQNMMKILAAGGINKTEMNPAPEIWNMFNTDYELIKSCA